MDKIYDDILQIKSNVSRSSSLSERYGIGNQTNSIDGSRNDESSGNFFDRSSTGSFDRNANKRRNDDVDDSYVQRRRGQRREVIADVIVVFRFIDAAVVIVRLGVIESGH